MVSGSWACTSITNPKSVGRLPLTSRHESPASSDRITSQCFCMNSTLGRERCSAMRCTQWPISAFGSGMYCERSEEHTSELQSRLHLVCRLLLEKKKKFSDRKSVYFIPT